MLNDNKKTGYPYTGGLYGDPNSKKKEDKPYTFLGPTADKALSSGARTALNQSPPESLSAEAGQQSGGFIDKTPKGYPHIGTTVPKSEPVLNVPFDNGQAAAPSARALLNRTTQQPQESTFTPRSTLSGGASSMSANENVQPGSLAGSAKAELPGKQPSKVLWKDGIYYEPGENGARTFTKGSGGQNQVKLTAWGRTGPREQVSGQPAIPGARQRLAGSPYSVEGSAQDVAAFNAPATASMARRTLAGTQQEGPSAQDEYHRWFQNSMSSSPSGTVASGGVDSILGRNDVGWKTKRDLLMKSLDMQENADRNQNALRIAGINEGGANSRALLNAGLQGEQNQIARDRLVGEMDLNKTRLAGDLDLNKARIAESAVDVEGKRLELSGARQLEDMQRRFVSEADPLKRDALGRQLLTLMGKSATEKPVYQTIKEDDGAGGVRERLFRVDGDRMVEIQPAISPLDIHRQKALLRDMDDDERKKHLQYLAQRNPALFDALNYEHQKRPLAAPVEPSTGQLLP